MKKFANEDLSRWKREVNPAPIIGKRIALHREGAEFLGCCPDVYHKEKTGHPDKNPSLRVWKMDDGTWGFKCFSCQANGNVFQFVQDYDKVPFTQAVVRVLEEAGVSGWQDGEEQPASDSGVADPGPKALVTFPMSEYAPAMKALEQAFDAQAWLAKRGITMTTARKFCLGFVQSAEKITSTNEWGNDGWILFPTLSTDRQTITAVKYRSIVAKKGKKSNGKENSGILRAPNTSTTIYNMQTVDLSGDVFVVEGEPDTLVLAQAGFNVVGYPMAGHKPTDEECELLSTAKRVFLAGDNDAAGKKAMAALQPRLQCPAYNLVWPGTRKDANDVLTKECENSSARFKALIDDLVDRAVQTRPKPILRGGEDIELRRVQWLWDQKIPLGKITLFAGNPDNGKSLASTSVAAICTRGRIYPGCTSAIEPSDVLLLLGEDDLDDTAAPRLRAADADMKRVHFLEAVRPVKEDNREVRLDMDIPAIEEQLIAKPSIRLLIIDPISNYLGNISMVAEQEVRTILIPLKRLAERYNIAIVIVMHLNKKNDLDAISRVGGAMAFIGVARCSWLFARNVKEKVEGEDITSVEERLPDTFSMLRIKNNLVSADKSGRSYIVKVTPVPVKGEPDMFVPYVDWGEAIDGNADDALQARRGGHSEPTPHREGPGRPDDALQEAMNWLQTALGDNKPQVSKILIADAHAGAGIAERTLRRAKQALGIRDFKEGAPARYFWIMDPIEATSETVADPKDTSMFEIEGETHEQ